MKRLLRLLRWSKHERDLREEIESHRLHRQDALERDGLSKADAARASRRSLGNVPLAVEDAREVWAMRVVDQTRQDVRAALRGLRKSPGFTFVTVATLALGIGANTALFSIFSSLILRPLPVRDPGTLAYILNGSWSYPIWQEIKQRETSFFDGAFAWSGQNFDLAPNGATDVVGGAYVSGRMFEVLGVTAVRGRMIRPADDSPAPPDGAVAVISERLWKTRFAGADDIVGRTMTVQRLPFTIVGVMPKDFFGLDVGRRRDVMLPFSAEPLIRGKDSRLPKVGSSWLQIMVRLKRGQPIEQGTAALATLPQLLKMQTRKPLPLTLASAATGGASALRNQFETPLFALILTVNLVLLVACANIASLLLARALSRRRELTVRLALGSSHGRIVRLLFVESLILVVAGAGLGLIFAQWGSALLIKQLSTYQAAVALDLFLDWRVLGFTAALASLAAITFSVVPVLRLKSLTAGDTLKEASRAITGERALSLRSTLVVAQIGVSFVLVVAAGLFMRTLLSLNQLPLGFDPEPLLVAQMNLQAGGPPETRFARVSPLLDAAAAVPGVRSAALSVEQLLQNGGWSSGINAIGDGPLERWDLWLNATTPGWFKTMGIALKSGRDFEAGDSAGSRPVAIVNDAFVRQYFGGRGGASPIGQTVRWKFDENTRREIVGVVADTVYTDVRDGMLPTMYVPVAQQKPEQFWGIVYLTLNTTAAQRGNVERDVAAAIKQLDPTVGVTFNAFDNLVDATMTQERLVAMLSSFFGGLALLLAAIGLYGAVAHAVRARQTEIGVRMALGAAPSSIMRLVFNRVGVMIGVGVAIGLGGSLWAAKFVGALLFRMEPRDPVTFTVAVITLVFVGVLAAWVPARRAARLDPAAVLREG